MKFEPIKLKNKSSKSKENTGGTQSTTSTTTAKSISQSEHSAFTPVRPVQVHTVKLCTPIFGYLSNRFVTCLFFDQVIRNKKKKLTFFSQQVKQDTPTTSQATEVTPSLSIRLPFNTSHAKQHNSFQAVSIQVNVGALF